MPKLLLDVKNVTKNYKSKLANSEKKVIQALKGVSLQIYKGEILSLLGENGAGKTTLSSIIATLHPPTSGQVLFEGKSVYQNIIDYRLKLGFCPQQANFENDLTVEDNLIFAGRYFNMPHNQVKPRAKELMQQFDLTQYSQSFPEILSGGYKQRLLIARALMHNPSLVILDEPTVGMDPKIRRTFLKKVATLKDEGISVLLTTHYLEEAEKLSDRVCIIDKGKICATDTLDNLKKKHQKKNLEEIFFHFVDTEKTSITKENND